MVELETERLFIREYFDSDKERLTEIINDLDVSRYLRNVPYPYVLSDAEWFINKCKKDAEINPRKTHDLTIELKGEKQLIGGIGMNAIDYFSRTGTLGYWIGKNYWRKGYAFEVAKEILKFAFEELNLRRIEVEADFDNEPSNNLIKKLGFTFEGTRRNFRKNKSTGQIPDTHQYGLLKSEWKG
jgi:[ribosomal protein S5]-alanine N-acetyltransferase